MKKHYKSLYAIATLAIALLPSAPTFAQTVNNLMMAQPVPQPSDVPAAEAPQVPSTAPESAQPQHPVVTTSPSQHHAPTTHHAAAKHHKKKKTTHNKSAKASSHTKKASKKVDGKSNHTVKKTVPPQQPHASNAHKHSRHQVAKANAEKHTRKQPSDVSSATLPVVKHEAPAHVASTATPAPKSVTYDFCLGYSNCTPTRYETTSVGGKTGAKIVQKDATGSWSEAKLDPTVMSDLNKMAQAEPGNRIERELTPDEKELLADHQGKAHATLVSAVNSGNKEEAKTAMRQLHIQNMNDLSAYDARLCTRDTAAQAVNEISVGR